MFNSDFQMLSHAIPIVGKVSMLYYTRAPFLCCNTHSYTSKYFPAVNGKYDSSISSGPQDSLKKELRINVPDLIRAFRCRAMFFDLLHLRFTEKLEHTRKCCYSVTAVYNNIIKEQC